MSALEDTLLATYRAARETAHDRFLDAMLDVLRVRVPFDAGRWATGNFVGGSAVFDSVHLVDEMPDWQNAYTQISAFDHAAKFAVSHQYTTGNFHFPTYFAGPANRAMRDYAQRFRHASGLVTCSKDVKAQVLINLSVFRADPDTSFAEAERVFVQSLYPHLIEAWKINQALQIERACDRTSPARWSAAICTPGGQIVLAEPSFTEALRTEWPAYPRLAGALPAPLAQAMQSGMPTFKGESHVFRFERGHEMALVRTRPRVPLDRLSTRELNVARLVSAGHSHKEVALLLGIAPATVRNHLQAIYDRAEIHSNTDLVAQMSAIDP